MDLSRREFGKYGALSLLGTGLLGKELEDRYEGSEEAGQALGLTGGRDFALQQIEELDNSYRSAARGNSGITDSVELLFLFLGNPNHFDNYKREGFIPDRQGLLEEQSPEKAFRSYAERGVEEIPFTSTQTSLLFDQELDIDLVYHDTGRDVNQLLENGKETIETELEPVLPEDYSLSVDAQTVQPDKGIQSILKDVSESPEEAITQLNEELGYSNESTLPVHIIDPREFDRLSALTHLDFSELWGGYGAQEGSLVTLPSMLMRTGEDSFYSTLVHEIGHSAFELPHSAVRDDTMTYNNKAGNPVEFGQPSQLLIQSYLESDLQIERQEKNGETGIYFQQKPGTVPQDRAEEAFFDNLNAYITDMVDNFDLKPERFEEINYRREDGYDIANYQNYNGTGVDMEIKVDQQIHQIQAS